MRQSYLTNESSISWKICYVLENLSVVFWRIIQLSYFRQLSNYERYVAAKQWKVNERNLDNFKDTNNEKIKAKKREKNERINKEEKEIEKRFADLQSQSNNLLEEAISIRYFNLPRDTTTNVAVFLERVLYWTCIWPIIMYFKLMWITLKVILIGIKNSSLFVYQQMYVGYWYAINWWIKFCQGRMDNAKSRNDQETFNKLKEIKEEWEDTRRIINKKLATWGKERTPLKPGTQQEQESETPKMTWQVVNELSNKDNRRFEQARRVN